MFYKTALARWQHQARRLKTEIHAIYLACCDPRTPWYARLVALGVVGYAFSPIDLIPDFIPVLGYLDDLLLLPLGIILVLKLIPPIVLAEARAEAEATVGAGKPTNWVAGGLIIALWLILALLVVRLFWQG
jgi:uncharacterized membrane protein YkvA (DUF1232 family)